ncbi:MAG: RNA-binding protein [Clostridia bacterium]|jgi:RNA-binding protein|nr:RNA-binding protein [Clostridia bacterium]
MLTSKQRAHLRGLGNTLEPIFLIGKGGVTEAMIKEIDVVLEKRELIKLKVLNNSLEDPREASNIIADQINADVVQVIGGKFILYRQAKENPQIEI